MSWIFNAVNIKDINDNKRSLRDYWFRYFSGNTVELRAMSATTTTEIFSAVYAGNLVQLSQQDCR